MDLCLRGSQINLVTRQKPKAKYSSQTNLATTTSLLSSTRPRSATFYTQHCRRSSNRASPPFSHCRRPQSADPTRFGRRCGSASSNSNCPFGLQRRYQSISSSNLLKLLLDEPIKRSWLCRGGSSGTLHSTDNLSDWNSSARQHQHQQHSQHSHLHQQRHSGSGSGSRQQRQRCESFGSSNSSGEQCNERLLSKSQHRNWQSCKMSSTAAYAKEKCNYNNNSNNNNNNNNHNNTAKTYANDYWSSSNTAKMLKPDLPGRVSFCKSNNIAAQPDFDSSDCDNDKQDAQPYAPGSYNSLSETATTSSSASTAKECISAPGPLSLPNFQDMHTNTTTTTIVSSSQATTMSNQTATTTTATTLPTTAITTGAEFYSLSAAQKKSVHFGAAGASGEVFAETYEYPKCPSENCSCSTRSSSTASLHDVLDGKCACGAATCRYALDTKANTNICSNANKLDDYRATTTTLTAATTATPTAIELSTKTAPSNPLEDSAVIREYKNVIGEQLENSIVKNLLCDEKMAGTSTATATAYGHLNNVELPDYLEKFSHVEKQNNLSDVTMRNNAIGVAAAAAAAASALYKTNTKRNLLTSGDLSLGSLAPTTTIGAAATAPPPAVTVAQHNNNNNNNSNNFEQYASSSDVVINNYLKVTGGGSAGGSGGAGGAGVAVGANAVITKKQENIKSNSAEAAAAAPLTRNRRVYNAKNSNNSNSNNNNLSSNNMNMSSSSNGVSSAGGGGGNSKSKANNVNANAERARLRKATSYGSLRGGDDANLNEFQLDKVDSWMSMHQAALNAGGGGAGGGGNSSGSAVAHSKSLSKLPTTATATSAIGIDLNGDDEVLAVVKHNKTLKLKRLNGKDDEDDSNSQLEEDDDDEDDDEDGTGEGEEEQDDENSQDDSTYDEIVSVIKQIEEDKKQDNYAERTIGSEMDLKLNTPTNEKRAANTTTAAATNTTRTAATSTMPEEMNAINAETLDKYKDILNYLDNVEDSCDKTLLETRRSMPDSNRSEVEFVVEPDIAEDVPKLTDLLLLPNHQLARRVIALSLRANELANALYLSKEHVNKIRAEKQKSVRAEKANGTQRMREQKKHFETIVKRHQGFIEQLLKDKGTLCEKVAALTRRLESQNQAWEHKLETEMARVKETALAGEKIRRERWVRENTKKIKELTVKGLEQEINKMTAAHQQEINDLKRAHQQQLLNALEEARLKHEQIENSIREACAQDRESIIEKERTAIRERFERQLEEEHRSFDDQKQKLCEDFAAERERLQQQLKDKDVDYQQRRQDLQLEKDLELEQALSELQQKMSRQEEKYQNRINTIERQYEADFEIWKREYENTCKLAQVEKENTIRQHYRAERDRQIDAIVTRMDAEAQKNSEEFETKVNRLKEKYERDLLEVENVEKSLREKYAETRNRLAESDAQVRNCQAEMKQLQIELEHSKKMCGDFVAERDQLREHLRQEIQNEVATIKAERDQEIQKIHKRVQQAIEKKDATVDILQKENGSLRERCLKLEAIIRQQRKDYCVK